MKNFFLSATMGIIAILLVNLTSVFTGVSLSINFISLAISSVLGIAGVITMIILGNII